MLPRNDMKYVHSLFDVEQMMLGLATHEPHFSLLREEVRFGGKKDRNKRYTCVWGKIALLCICNVSLIYMYNMYIPPSNHILAQMEKRKTKPLFVDVLSIFFTNLVNIFFYYYRTVDQPHLKKLPSIFFTSLCSESILILSSPHWR